jgi:hypothetical protein
MERVINSKTKLKTIGDVVYAFNEDGAYIYKVNKMIGNICIFEDVIDGVKLVGIGKAAFCNCKHLDKLILPKTITYIHEEAFVGCPASVEISKTY